MTNNTTNAGAGASDQLRREVQEILEAHRDQTYEIGAFISTQGAVLGVRVPVIRQLVKTFRNPHPDLTVGTASQLLDLFCQNRSREGFLFGTLLLAEFRRQFSPSLWNAVDRWVECIDNWETCDQLAMNVAGELVVIHLSLVEDLVAWTSSPNPWRRRFAVASTSVLNQKGRSYAVETFRVCEPVIADEEPVVQKAVGWVIREVCKKNEQAAFEFLMRNKDRANPSVLREASKKLSPDHQTLLLHS